MEEKDWKAYLTPRNCLLTACVIIVILAGWLRTVAAADTVIDRPFRADVVQYYVTAYNLNTYGVYSHILTDLGSKAGGPPKPDAFITPGYPLFLALFVDAPPNPRTFVAISSWQALLSTFAVLLALLLLMRISPWIALPAALLAAMSPQLVTIATYMLSETLFSVLLLLSLLALSQHARDRRWYLPALLGGGLLLGAAALTRPVLELFPLAVIFMLWITYDRRTALRGTAALVLGFCLVWTPWVARNYISHTSGDSANLVQTMAIGMYPDFEYDHDPKSEGEPGSLDPRFPEFSKSLGETVGEISRRFRENPGEELRWYLIGKPIALWSWHGVGGGQDVFTYPVFVTPYSDSPLFILTHEVMRALHWPLVILALIGCILVWLPGPGTQLAPESLFLARLMSLLLLYNTAVLMVLAPFVRYSIPFLPVLYAMAVMTLYLAVRWRKSRAGFAQ